MSEAEKWLGGLTSEELVTAYAGREDEGIRSLVEAIGKLYEARDTLHASLVAKTIAMCAGFGKSEAETRAFLLSTGLVEEPKAAEPTKRQRAPKAKPPAPADDLLRAHRVLAAEAMRGTERQVKLEPNGRTWVRGKP